MGTKYIVCIQLRGNGGITVIAVQHTECSCSDDVLQSEGSGDAVRSDDDEPSMSRRRPSILPTNVMKSVIGVKFIADHMKQQEEEKRVSLRFLIISYKLSGRFTQHYSAVALVLPISIVVSGVVRVNNSTGAFRRDQTNTV